MMRSRLLGAVGIVAVVGGVLSAQTPASRAFDVASVKPNRSGLPFGNFQIEGNLVTFTNTALRELIRNAYDIRDLQLIGGPSWLNTDHFDIAAKADVSAAERLDLPRIKIMTRALLAERFKLVVHNERREMPIYALVLARSDGTFGAQLRRTTVDCATAKDCGTRGGPGTLRGRGITMVQLAISVLPWVDRLAVDRTGLTGTFDVDLQWTPDRLPPGASPPGVSPPPIDTNSASIFTAVQEQLGLKLESTKGPVDVLVIDHVEPPTPD
jgi:uncharacterized protein (TIGR03435 family)